MEVLETERVVYWNDSTDSERAMVYGAHVESFRIVLGSRFKPDILRRLFELGTPKIVFGRDNEYCRIHPDSVDVMSILTRQYLFR